MKKKKISAPQRQILLEVTLLNIEYAWQQIKTLRSAVERIKAMEVSYEKRQMDASLDNHHLCRLTEYAILIHLISADLGTAYRIYLNSKTDYEVTFACRQLVLIIDEGFKQMYEYASPDKENGNLVTTKQNESFWLKDIGGLVNGILPDLKPRYDELSNELDVFNDPEFEAITASKNLFVHYDRIPSDLVDGLYQLNMESLNRKVMPFMSIVQGMMVFCFELVEGVMIYNEQKNNNLHGAHTVKSATLISELHRENLDLMSMIGEQKDFFNSFLA